MESVYLDWASTTREDPAVSDLVRDIALFSFGNPSSRHSYGKEAARLLEESRATIASGLACGSEQVLFTSGGSEANNIILTSLLLKRAGGSVLISGIEHPSVYEPAALLNRLGFGLIIVPAEKDGHMDAERIGASMREDTILVSVMLVNNETGAVQPVQDIAKAVRSHSKRRVHIHADCVQGFGKLPIDVKALGVDSISASAHKIQGPRGVGLLYLARPIETLYRGGGQEGGLRPGTENLPGIAGFALAAKKRLGSMEEDWMRASRLKALLLEGVGRIGGALVIPDYSEKQAESYSPYITALSFPPVPGEVLVRVLSDKGFAVSTGAACSSKKAGRGRVLEAMGVPKEARDSAIRVSTGFTTREEDIRSFVSCLEETLRELRPR